MFSVQGFEVIEKPTSNVIVQTQTDFLSIDVLCEKNIPNLSLQKMG